MQDETKKNDFKFIRWVFSIFLILLALSLLNYGVFFNIVCVSFFCLITSGLLIVPLISDRLPQSKQIKTIKFYFVLLLILTGFFHLPDSQTVYIKSNIANLYKTNSNAIIAESRKQMQTISIYKMAQKNGYYLTDDFLWIKKEDIAFSLKDPVLQKLIKKQNQIKQEKIKKQNKIKKQKIKKEKQAKLLKKKAEAKLTNELKNSLDKIVKDYDIQSYEYDYYINDIDWLVSSYSDKKAFFALCSQYGSIYTKSKDDYEIEMTKTKIKSNNNGQLLGEYSILHGYKFK